MMEDKQTAIDWLVKQVKLGDKSFDEFFRGEIQQAKQMEKEQIKNACEEGFMWSAEGWNGELLEYYKDGNETLELHKEEYYNENYGK